MNCTITLDGLPRGIITTDHASASYGRPVYVLDGIAYGPADLLLNAPGDTSGGLILAAHYLAKVCCVTAPIKRPLIADAISAFIGRPWDDLICTCCDHIQGQPSTAMSRCCTQCE